MQTAPIELQSGPKHNNQDETNNNNVERHRSPKCQPSSQHGHTSSLVSLSLSLCTTSSTLSPNHALTLPNAGPSAVSFPYMTSKALSPGKRPPSQPRPFCTQAASRSPTNSAMSTHSSSWSAWEFATPQQSQEYYATI